MAKPINHWILKNNEGGHWGCHYMRCDAGAEFLIFEQFAKDTKQKGACEKHARKWAKDCEGCTKKINEFAAAK